MNSHPYLTVQQCADLMMRDAKARRAEVADTLAAQVARAEAAGAYDNCARFLREHAVLRWRDNVPTEDGLYWHRLNGEAIPRLVRVQFSMGPTRGDWVGTHVFGPSPQGFAGSHDILGAYHRSESGVHWAGPLPEPEEPL